MRVLIQAGTVTLLDPTQFDSFDVSAPDLTVDGALEALAADGLANEQPGHVFVSIAAVRRWAGDVDDTWESGFQAMIGYAESKGWLDATGGFIAAHLAESD